MDWLFGKKISPDEMLRKNQRALNKAMRDLDRERMKMDQQEKKIIADIKKMAKEGQMDAVKIMAKDLVRTRRYSKKFMLMKANIQAVSLKIQTLKSQNTMAQAMKGEIGCAIVVVIHRILMRCFDCRCHQGYAEHEPTTESPANTEDPAGFRKTIRDDGHEGRDDQRRHRRCHGGRRR